MSPSPQPNGQVPCSPSTTKESLSKATVIPLTVRASRYGTHWVLTVARRRWALSFAPKSQLVLTERHQPQFLKLKHSGTFSNLKVLNAPRQVFSIGSNSAQLIIDSVTIDNSAGDELSGGKTLGHNTDCFDVSATNVIIKNSRCVNQDDCLAINKGSAIQFLNNYCSGESQGRKMSDFTLIEMF